jgi:hypothetical protein
MMTIAIVTGNHLVPGLDVAIPGPFSGPSPAEAMHQPIEGFGAGTTGGAGKPTCTVTSLANSGPGTLRDCLSAGNRYVKFGVAGTIPLSTTINVPSNVTIDGFSAPQPGITVTNRAFNIWDTSNIIMQGFRIHNIGFTPPRNPDTETGTVNGEIDCVSVYGGAVSHVVFNHMSIVGCGDGAIDISTGPKDITIQWSIVSTGKGVLWGTTDGGSATAITDRISMHHTMMICNDRPVGCDRFPLIRASGYVTRVDLRHNIFEGWIRANGSKIEPRAWTNVIGNAYIPRPASTFAQREGSIALNRAARVYTSGNIELGPAPRPNLNDNGNESSPMPAPAITSRQLGCVVREAGLHPRDPVEERLLTYVTAVPAGCDDSPMPPPRARATCATGSCRVRSAYPTRRRRITLGGRGIVLDRSWTRGGASMAPIFTGRSWAELRQCAIRMLARWPEAYTRLKQVHGGLRSRATERRPMIAKEVVTRRLLTLKIDVFLSVR